MVYAYDQWAQMPVKDLYDTQIMAMSIAAAKDMYEKGQKQLEDFNNKYGDFMSPIAKDMDWYNQNVTGKVRDTINNLYANGIDPLRSAEGRAAVAQLIYSMPTGDIAKLRQSAEAAKEYIKNRGILEAAGKWDPNFERFANQGSMLEDWDTMSNGVWNRTSPAELKTLKELTEPWYNQRTAHTLDKAGVESFGLKYDPRYDYTGFTNQDLLNIASGQTPGWNGSIYSDYYRDVARRQLQNMGIENPNANQVEAMLQRNIATANKEYLINPTLSVNPLYLQDLKNRQAMAIASMRGGRKSGNGQGNNDSDAPTTFMDRLQRNIGWNFQNKQSGPDAAANTFNSILGYWDKMMKSVESKGKVAGQKDVDVPVSKGIVTPSPYGAGPNSFSIAKTNVVTEKGKENVYDQSNNALYKKYAYEKARWSNFASGNYYPSRYDKTMMGDGKTPAYKEINRILKKGDKATPEEIRFLDSYIKQDFQKMWIDANSSSPKWSGQGNQPKGTMSTRDAKKRASDMWDSFSAEGLGGIQNKVLHQRFVGATNTQKDPDLENGYYRVRFGSGYHYAPVRQLNITGNARFKYNDIHSKFDRFLNGQIGISIDENDVKAAGMPVKGRIGMQLDILSHPLLSKETIQDFYNHLSYAEKQKYPSVDVLAKELGLRARNEKIKYRDKNEELHSSDTYYEVPVIKTIDNSGGQNFRDINALSDILEFNAGIADKNIWNSENQAFMEDLPIELATSLIQ